MEFHKGVHSLCSTDSRFLSFVPRQRAQRRHARRASHEAWLHESHLPGGAPELLGGLSNPHTELPSPSQRKRSASEQHPTEAA